MVQHSLFRADVFRSIREYSIWSVRGSGHCELEPRAREKLSYPEAVRRRKAQLPGRHVQCAEPHTVVRSEYRGYAGHVGCRQHHEHASASSGAVRPALLVLTAEKCTFRLGLNSEKVSCGSPKVRPVTQRYVRSD